MKQVTIINIVCFFFMQVTFWAFAGKDSTLTKNGKIELRQALESIEETSDIRFIYSDNTIKGKSVESFSSKYTSPKNIKKLLSEIGLLCRVFSGKTFVLYEDIKEEKSRRLYEKVVTNEEFAKDDSYYFVQKPVLLSGANPVYPEKAILENLQGRVKIKFKVDREGNVKKSCVLETSGEAILDSVSRDYVYNLKYSPAQANGIKYEVWVTMVFEYILSDSVYKK